MSCENRRSDQGESESGGLEYRMHIGGIFLFEDQCSVCYVTNG